MVRRTKRRGCRASPAGWSTGEPRNDRCRKCIATLACALFGNAAELFAGRRLARPAAGLDGIISADLVRRISTLPVATRSDRSEPSCTPRRGEPAVTTLRGRQLPGALQVEEPYVASSRGPQRCQTSCSSAEHSGFRFEDIANHLSRDQRSKSSSGIGNAGEVSLCLTRSEMPPRCLRRHSNTSALYRMSQRSKPSTFPTSSHQLAGVRAAAV
jgi:hypothetical protein